MVYYQIISPRNALKNVFTAKSDQFNIAALLYHMITGIIPWFSEPQDFEISAKSIDNLEVNRNSPLKFADIFDDHIKSVINKGLNYNFHIHSNE